MSITLDDDTYWALAEKARAWDVRLKERLTEGRIEARTTILCKSPRGCEIQISDDIIVSPFGEARMTDNPDGSRTVHMKPGDEVTLSREIQLKIT